MEYKQLSEARKKGQEDGQYPEWFTTGGYQLFTQKYSYEGEGFRGTCVRIARAAAKHLPKDNVSWEERFFALLWRGWLSCSTPVLGNLGTTRALPVSCAGSYIGDSIDDFYGTLRETALLSKYGFGTSGYLGDIRPRGAPVSIGGSANGVLPVIKEYVQMSRNVSQGNSRRGAWAGYLPIDHGDFHEVVDYMEQNPDDLNIGWIVSSNFISKLNAGCAESLARYQRALKAKMVTGKGYFFFVDKANEKRPQCYKDRGLDIKASQLCSEIMLHSSKDYTYTCVLSSMNLAKYDEWKNTDAVYVATVFLDCVAAEFIERARVLPGMEKAVAFTRRSRALGLGVAGFHTLLQKRMLPFESFEAHMLNNEIFKRIREEAERASKWLAGEIGEAEWAKGTGMRNTHLIAVAPTKSTALIMGGISEGINPDPAMTYTQTSAAGEIERINPVLLALMKEKKVYNRSSLQEVIDAQGSVQGVSWLTEEEKKVFKTAFEIDQRAVLRLASARAKFIDQWQSLNLFFSADEDPAYISQIHKEAFLDDNILALYYCYSKAGVTASKDSCEACQ